MQRKNAWLLLPLCLLAACAAKESPNKASAKQNLSPGKVAAAADSVSFASDISDINSSSRKVIRTADFRCRVDDVFAATTALERAVKANGGIVQDSHMTNESNTTHNVYYKPDSLKQVQSYTTTAQLTLRVPAAALDSVVNTISGLSAFIDQRNLSQDDVTLKYLSNALKNNGATEIIKPLALAKKSNEAMQAENYDEGKRDEKIARRMENLQMLDDANYATISVAFYQPERISTTVVVNTANFTQPPYELQLMLALSRGWELLRGLLLLCITIWPLWLLAAAGLFLYKRYRKPLAVRS